MRNLIYLIILLGSSWISIAQQSSTDTFTTQPIKLGTSFTFFSTSLNENRTINIYLPSSYDKETATSYPVIYLLDGSLDEDFIHIVGLVQFATFSWAQLIPESIVVGISNVDRKRDFTYPTTNAKDKKDFPTTGESKQFIAYLENELQPFIAKEFRVTSERTIIGQSLGGLLATEILWTHPHLFSNYVIVSPSLWWDDNSLLLRPPERYRAGKRNPLKTSKKVFVAVGQEGPIMEAAALGLAANLKTEKNIQTYFKYLDGLDHTNTLHQAVYEAFKVLYTKEKKPTMINKQALIDRFLSYVTIDTESDPNSDTTPSSEKQWDLARLLAEQLEVMGMTEVTLDQNAYVMATLPATVAHDVPVIGFVSHFDTTPDFTGKNVNPQIIENYDGGDIILNKDQDIVLSPDYFDDLRQYEGQTIITTDGTTLLGADDKAGITEIMEAMQYLLAHPEIPHGKIRVGFTPDEEIGRGAHKFDVAKFGAAWAYTMDGSQIGELEYENFNAAGAVVTIEGKIVHPGYAKGKMVNSMYIATDYINSLPRLETPEHTSDREGFFHLYSVDGGVDSTKLEYIIRDHDKGHFEARKEMMVKLADELNAQLEKNAVTVDIKDQYFNMREKLEPVMHIVDIAEEAMTELGIEPLIKPIRGGTDGSQLSFMGLPCPNIFAGGHNFHGRYEYVPVESMMKAVEVIVKIAEITARQ